MSSRSSRSQVYLDEELQEWLSFLLMLYRLRKNDSRATEEDVLKPLVRREYDIRRAQFEAFIKDQPEEPEEDEVEPAESEQ